MPVAGASGHSARGRILADSIDASLQYFSLPEFRSGWARIQRGIEKESLRVTPDGRLAQTDHPEPLGSALTHPYITTDYSEALLELITPVSESIDETLEFLTDLHTWVYEHLPDDERLWVTSMPCLLESEEQIPLAHYGSSNIGRLKTLYREGLGHRYGRLMQTISGIHYNFSMPESFWPEYRAWLGCDEEPLQDFQTRQYLHLIRNFHRYSWLLAYLFGASPAVCECFTQGRSHDLQPFRPGTLYRPYATCLRMGELGYKSEAQKSIFICYNELDNYIDSLHQAMSTPYPPYEAIGDRRDGRYLQMNTNLLQLENEFYASIRPKRVGDSGDRPLSLLLKRGIEYIEVRALDLDPFLPLGIDTEQIRFLDAFLLYCLFSESPECTEAEHFQIEDNLARVVNDGRDPELTLKRDGETLNMRDWAGQIMAGVEHSASLLDHAAGGTRKHHEAVAVQQAKVADASLTPSARMLEEMARQEIGFYRFGMEQSLKARALFLRNTLSATRRQAFSEASGQSRTDQAEMENGDRLDFDEFLSQWNAFRVK